MTNPCNEGRVGLSKTHPLLIVSESDNLFAFSKWGKGAATGRGLSLGTKQQANLLVPTEKPLMLINRKSSM